MFQDSHADIADGVIEIAETFQFKYNSINIAIGGILPCDASWSINRVLIKEVREILKGKFSKLFFVYISYDSCCTVANGLLNPDLFFLDNVHLVEQGNLKLAESIFSSIENCNSITCNKQKQFLISYKMTVSFELNNSDFPLFLFLLYLNLFPLFLLCYHLLLHVGLQDMLVLIPINLTLVLPMSVMVLFV